MLYTTTISFLLGLLASSLAAAWEISSVRVPSRYSWLSPLKVAVIISLTIFFSAWVMFPSAIFLAMITVLLWLMIFWGSGYLQLFRFATARGIISSLLAATLSYLIFRYSLILSLHQSVGGVVVSWMYFTGECITLAILFYLTMDGVIAIDVKWRETDREPGMPDSSDSPHVTIHVPISNEPVDVVRQTLYSLFALRYPSYDVIVIDNNTPDPAQWMPVKDICDELGFTFHHVERLEGFKAGALNVALSMTLPESKIIAIVDADYVVKPDFLSETVRLFNDPKVAFVQTAQGYRNEDASRTTSQFSQVYRYFFSATMVARNQRNSIIFAGTMGLIRRSALDEVLSWAEWSITEDAELSLRLLAKGYRGVYLNRTYGLGLMPENFIDLRRQWYRWVFGGLQLAIHHLRRTLLSRDNALTVIQRLDYILGGAISLLASLMILTTLGLIGTNVMMALSISGSIGWELFPETIKTLSRALTIYHGFLLFHSFSICYICMAVSGCSWRKALTTLVSFHSLVGMLAQAATRALVSRKGVFIRTPKHPMKYEFLAASRTVRLEVLLLVGLAGSMLLLIWRGSLQQFSVGLMVLGLWQLNIYASAVIRAVQSLVVFPVGAQVEAFTTRTSSK